MKIINSFFKVLFYPIKLIFIGFIYFYKFCLSPLLPHSCKYSPTCSSYMLLAINRFGVFKGVFLGVRRIFRCNPFAKGGIDPVPVNMKGETLWLL